jgi:hypothetical protein
VQSSEVLPKVIQPLAAKPFKPVTKKLSKIHETAEQEHDKISIDNQAQIDKEKERAIAKLQAMIDEQERQSKIDAPADFGFSSPQYRQPSDDNIIKS